MFSVWVTLNEQKWVTLAERRGTAQLAIQEACLKGGIVQDNGQYRLPL